MHRKPIRNLHNFRSRALSVARSGISSVAIFVVGLVWTSAASAAFITNYPPEPGLAHESPTVLDLTSFLLNVSYDGAGHLSVASQFDNFNVLNDDSLPIYDIGGTSDLSIALTLDPVSGDPLSGSLLITGDASNFYTASSSHTLLQGTISAFGFPNPAQAAAAAGAENFQFIFNTTGGDLAPFYPEIATNLTLIGINFSGTFGNTGFSDTSGNAQSDTFTAPEPASLLLLGIGALALIVWLRMLRRSIAVRGSPLR